MENTSTEFEVPRAIQTVAALGGLAIDAYLAAHANRQARLGAPQSAPQKQPFAEVLRQAGSSIPGLQDALVALAGEEHAADVKKLAELVSENGDLGELVRKATMNARGAVAADPGAASGTAPARPAGSSDAHAALGAVLARGEEAESRARLLAMLQSSVEERLALMEARLNGRVSALQQRVIHLEASIDGLAQDIERLKQRVRMRRDASASRAAGAAPEIVSSNISAATGETAPESPRLESEVPAVAQRVESAPPASEPIAPAPHPEPAPSRKAIASASAPVNEPAAASDARDPGLMAMLDARERQHDARITEGEQVVVSLSQHVTTLMAQVRELSAELDHDA